MSISGCSWLVFLYNPLNHPSCTFHLTDDRLTLLELLLIQTSALNVTLSSSLSEQNAEPVSFYDVDISPKNSAQFYS